MKKLFLIIVTLCAAWQGYAQRGIAGVAIGPKLAANASVMNTDIANTSYLPGVGFGAGLALRVKIVKLYIQPEVLYSVRSFRTEFKTTNALGVDIKTKTSSSFSTIDVPVMVGLYLFKIDDIGPRIYTGPVGSYVLSQKLEGNLLEGDNKMLKDVLVSWRAGIGLDIRRFNIDLSYDFGLNDVSKAAGVKTLPNLLQFALSYKFRLKD